MNFVKKCVKRFCSTEANKSFIQNFFHQNKSLFVTGAVLSSFSYFFYYTMKFNTKVEIKILPSVPLTGITRDNEKMQPFLEKFTKNVHKKPGLKHYCLYGKLGCGKSVFAGEFCNKLFFEQRLTLFPPESKIIVFLDCSTKTSFLNSLLDFIQKIFEVENKNVPFEYKFENKNEDELIEICLEKIEYFLKNQKGWVITWDNISQESYLALKPILVKYLFGDYFKDHNGTFLILCDTNDPILKNTKYTYRVNGLSLTTALELFQQHANISPESLNLDHPDVNRAMRLIHTQPLNIISFAMLVKQYLIEFPTESINMAIQVVENDIIEKVTDDVDDRDINLTPDNFESLFSKILLEKVTSIVEEASPSAFQVLNALTLLNPVVKTPETLINKFFANLDLQQNIDKENNDFYPIVFDNEDISFNDSPLRYLKQKKHNFMLMYEDAKNMYEYYKNLALPNRIPRTQKITADCKNSPFINVTSSAQQDFLSLHPLIYNHFRRNFFLQGCEALSPISKLKEVVSNTILTQIGYKDTFDLPKFWYYANLNTQRNSKIEEVSPKKHKDLSIILHELYRALDHSDPVNFPHVWRLNLLRSQHLHFVGHDLKNSLTSPMSDKKLKRSETDKKSITRFFVPLLKVCNKLGFYDQTLVNSKEILEFLNNKLFKEPTFHEFDIISIYLEICESLIATSNVNECEPYLKSLWNLSRPYFAATDLLSAPRLLLLIVKYHKKAEKRLLEIEDLDLMCHGLQKIAILLGMVPIGSDQIVELIFDYYLTYASELIDFGYNDFADYVIKQCDKSNIDTVKLKNPKTRSPYDLPILNLKIKLETAKGNKIGVKNLQQNITELA